MQALTDIDHDVTREAQSIYWNGGLRSLTQFTASPFTVDLIMEWWNATASYSIGLTERSERAIQRNMAQFGVGT
jgi:hypothetical protein